MAAALLLTSSNFAESKLLSVGPFALRKAVTYSRRAFSIAILKF